MNVDETPAIAGGDPILDEGIGYGGQSITDADKQAVIESLEGDYITRGPTVDEFEAAVADFVGVDHAVAVTSGTAALHLCGLAAGFGPGDEVITTPLTFASTAHAAVYSGATPVFADVDRETRNIDPAAVRERITEDTVGLVPMDYAGQPCEVDELLAIADDHDLTVIWDTCHSLGSTWNGERTGQHGDAAIFSFHPVKNITTGEGGVVVTDDDEFAERVRSLRSFEMNYAPDGHEDEPWFQVTVGVGYNYNVTELQAALGLSQLDRIEAFKRRRNEIVQTYDAAFADLPGVITPTVKDDVNPMWHLYAVEIGDEFGCGRKRFVNAMHAENIYVQVHYVPLHYHPFFQGKYGYERGQFPSAEAVYDGIVSLPMFPAMGDEDVENVIQAVERLRDYHA
jgi:perosamine synthetase